jgi:hypothetical protein
MNPVDAPPGDRDRLLEAAREPLEAALRLPQRLLLLPTRRKPYRDSYSFLPLGSSLLGSE